MPASRPPRRRRISILVGLALVALVALIIALRGERAPEPVVTTAPKEPATDRSAAPPPARAPSPSPAASAQPPVPPGSERWYDRMMATRRGLIAKLDYAPGAVPLAGKTDIIKPHVIPPAERPLQDHSVPGKRGTSEDHPGEVHITQRQSRLFLTPGEIASASFEAVIPDGTHPPVTVSRAEMTRDPASGSPVPIVFHDDGAAPDEQGGDGVFSAAVPPSPELLTGFTGDLVLNVDLTVAGESGTLVYRFAQTGAVPARFTQGVRDVLEAGSLAIYVGLDVYHAGRYEIRGRLYDARNTPVALLSFVDELTTDDREVKLFTYGKLLRDQGAQPPFTLHDLEGWHYLLGEYPDRELMAPWAAGYRTAAYPITSFTTQTWDSPQKRAKIESFDNAVRETMASQHAPPAPGGKPAR
jgi:hypothetical protein